MTTTANSAPTAGQAHGPVTGPRRPRRTRRAAWLVPFDLIGFAAGMVVGEGLAALLGHPDTTAGVPWWVALVAGGVGTIVLLAAPVAGLLSARSALRHGEPGPAPRALLLLHGAVLAVLLASTALGLLGLLVGG